jgi:hypothetical protein
VSGRRPIVSVAFDANPTEFKRVFLSALQR